MTKKNIMRRVSVLAFAALIVGFGVASEASAQNRQRRPTRPRPVPARKPAAPTVQTPAIGSGVGVANGSGMGTATGNGTGTPVGSSLGQPTGITIVSNDGNSVGNATGTVGNIGNETPIATAPANTPTPRTYIKEMNGRCYYVTNAGSKRFVARTNCSMFP